MRPSKDEYFLAMAMLVSSRATCLRRHVGCVLVSARGHVLATGYNGVAAGMLHCNHHDPFHETGFPFACDGATAASGTKLDACQAVHAEQNALLQCRDVFEIDTAYCTASPCITCVKLLLNTDCRRVVFADEYPHGEAKELWIRARGAESWIQGIGINFTLTM